MNTQLARQLILRASTSPVTSNFDKHLMLKAAEQIELLQSTLNALQSATNALQSAKEQAEKERDHWYSRTLSTPWETR